MIVSAWRTLAESGSVAEKIGFLKNVDQVRHGPLAPFGID